MYTALTEKTVTCAKRHGCAWCAGVINKGQKAAYRSYVYDSDFNHDWMHLDCSEASIEYGKQEGAFEFMPGDFPRGSTEPY